MRWPFALAFVAVLGLATLLRYVFLPVLVSGSSMEPAFEQGDFLLMKRHAAPGHPINRFDIVTARLGGELVLKRVIALPGEWVKMVEGQIFINGKALNEPYPIQKGSWTLEEGILGANRYLLMGDNRAFRQQVIMIVPDWRITGARNWQAPSPNLKR